MNIGINMMIEVRFAIYECIKFELDYDSVSIIPLTEKLNNNGYLLRFTNLLMRNGRFQASYRGVNTPHSNSLTIDHTFHIYRWMDFSSESFDYFHKKLNIRDIASRIGRDFRECTMKPKVFDRYITLYNELFINEISDAYVNFILAIFASIEDTEDIMVDFYVFKI